MGSAGLMPRGGGATALTMLDDAYRITGAVVERIVASDLTKPTPCEDWDVRDVLNHLVGVIEKFTAFADGATDRPRHPDGDRLEPDPLSAYQRATASSSSAWYAYAWPANRLCHLPFGSYPATTAIGIVCFDALVHGWDVAVATGRPIGRDTGPWSFALATAMEVVPDAERDGRHYAAARRLPDTVSPDVALLAYLGRAS